MSCPNFRVLSDFRKQHHDFFHACFKQIIQLALGLRFASLGHISLDGSKLKADSSKHKAMSYRHLVERERQLTGEIDQRVAQAAKCDAEEDARYREKSGYELPEDLRHKQARLAKIQAARAALEAREQGLHPGEKIDDTKQISFADHDARIMGKKGDFDYSCNGQISVDSDFQIIVGQHLSQNANDKQELRPVLAQVEHTTGRLPDTLSSDNGYFSGTNLAAIEEKEVDGLIAVDRGERTTPSRYRSVNDAWSRPTSATMRQPTASTVPGARHAPW